MPATSAKDLVLRPIPAREASELIRRIHYSGKVSAHPQVHIGVFLGGVLEGALQFGPPLDRGKVLGLVRDTRWEQMVELTRLALSERLPRNSESRVIAIACRLLRRHRPEVKWLLSFADAAQCGDGTIYRASGFVLTGIRRSTSLARLPDGSVVHAIAIQCNLARARPELGGRSLAEITGGRYDFTAYCEAAGAEVIPGYQLRYIRFLDATWRERLTVPEIPYSRITEVGARMYRGERAGSIDGDAPADQAGEGGSTPTPALSVSG